MVLVKKIETPNVGLFFFLFNLTKNYFIFTKKKHMNLINVTSERGIVNLLADYILKSINKTKEYDTIIEVVNCGRFFVVNGLTSSKEILDLNEVKESFLKEFEFILRKLNYESINIIDVVTYGVELQVNKSHWFTYHNSDRPIYQKDNIVKYNEFKEEISCVLSNSFLETEKSNVLHPSVQPSLNIISEFPYGYSLSMGRLLMYYGEYISNQIFNVIMTDKITFKVSTEKNNEDDFDIRIISNSPYKESDIVSMVLDNFDFNLGKFKVDYLSYDTISDLLYPDDVKPWLVNDKKRGLVIF
jgi:hypothetical protein